MFIYVFIFFFKQKTAYEMRISDWSSDVCSSDLVDQDNKFWQATFVRMREMMRSVIDFLNELDADIDEYSRSESPLAKFVDKARWVAPETLRQTTTFRAPARSAFVKGPQTVKIQYSRRTEKQPSELQSLLRHSYAVSRLQKKNT